jgi:hypothetical protein
MVFLCFVYQVVALAEASRSAGTSYNLIDDTEERMAYQFEGPRSPGRRSPRFVVGIPGKTVLYEGDSA